jgi:hypothetical protein
MVCGIKGLVLNFRAWELLDMWMVRGLQAAKGVRLWDSLTTNAKGSYIVGTKGNDG